MASARPLERARSRAIDIIDDALKTKTSLDELITQACLQDDGLQRPWLMDVVSGVLRFRGRIDLILDTLAEKKKPTGLLRGALSIALYQILCHTRAIPQQVVSETVDWVKEALGIHPSRFVNAVLRRAVSVFQSGSAFAELRDRDPASWYSVPSWIYEKLLADHGRDWTESYLEASLHRPVTWVREKALEETGKPGSKNIGTKGDVDSVPGFKEGNFIVQDLSNQKLVERVKEILKENFKSTEPTFLDLCAAPGGKTIAMCWEGFSISAAEANPDRIPLLMESIMRTKQEASVKIEPWEKVIQEKSKWDAIWLDAPCTSLGLIRRHPEIRWRRKPHEVANLARAQDELLKLSWSLLKPGGILFYSVCSPLKDEGEKRLKEADLSTEWSESLYLGAGETADGDGLFFNWTKKPL